MNINNSTTKFVFKDEKPKAILITTKGQGKRTIIYNNYIREVKNESGRIVEYSLITENEANNIRREFEDLEKSNAIADELCKRFSEEMKANEIGGK